MLSHDLQTYSRALITAAVLGVSVISSCSSYEPTADESHAAPLEISTETLNINRATARELEELPGVGRRRAEAIVAYRQRYGPFRRPEHLIAVEGISDRQLRELLKRIRVE